MRKILTLFIPLWVLSGFIPASAAVVSTLDWAGNLMISGFSSLKDGSGGNLENPDGNMMTMTFSWKIDDGSLHSIGASSNPTTVQGAVEVINITPTGNLFLPIEPIADIVGFLPVGSVLFGAGFQADTIIGSPLTEIDIVDPILGLNSTLKVSEVSFNGDTMIFQVEEEKKQGGPISFAGLLATGDGFGNKDGKVSRAFDLDIIISEVPIPAGVWLFFSGLVAFSSFRFKV